MRATPTLCARGDQSCIASRATLCLVRARIRVRVRVSVRVRVRVRVRHREGGHVVRRAVEPAQGYGEG